MIDVSLFTGTYPFRNLLSMRGSGTLGLMDKIGCEKTIATAFESIFYKNNLDGLKKVIGDTDGCGKRVFHYAVINPTFPGWRRDIDEALELPGVVGIRLFPRYHHYDLSLKDFLALMEIAAERNIPVNLTSRLLDDRLGHWLVNIRPPLQLFEVEVFLKKCQRNTIILSMFDSYEYDEPVLGLLSDRSVTLLKSVESHPRAYVDIGGCIKSTLFWLEELIKRIDPSHLLLGTGAPLYYYGGTLLSLEKSKMTNVVKKKILRENAEALFNIGGSSANH